MDSISHQFVTDCIIYTPSSSAGQGEPSHYIFTVILTYLYMHCYVSINIFCTVNKTYNYTFSSVPLLLKHWLRFLIFCFINCLHHCTALGVGGGHCLLWLKDFLSYFSLVSATHWSVSLQSYLPLRNPSCLVSC